MSPAPENLVSLNLGRLQILALISPLMLAQNPSFSLDSALVAHAVGMEKPL